LGELKRLREALEKLSSCHFQWGGLGQFGKRGIGRGISHLTSGACRRFPQVSPAPAAGPCIYWLNIPGDGAAKNKVCFVVFLRRVGRNPLLLSRLVLNS
jgi:hypothetical protein